jgi:hypothetical protein
VSTEIGFNHLVGVPGALSAVVSRTTMVASEVNDLNLRLDNSEADFELRGDVRNIVGRGSVVLGDDRQPHPIDNGR